jgi:AcrR family transcriptional regulator
MDGTAPPPLDQTAPRGLIAKRRAILEAAFTVFARHGYAHASMEEIADLAGVAKHTVYNHLGDKESVFRAALASTASVVMEENVAVAEGLRTERCTNDEELRACLRDVSRRLLRQCCDPRSWALRRLLYSEITRSPDLLEVVWGRGADQLRQTLADRLARLSLVGLVRRCDPVAAAEQLLALLTGPMEVRSQLGARHVPEEERHAVADAAVETFLLAYGPGRPGDARPA